MTDLHDYLGGTYSQAGEEGMIMALFAGQQRGVYMDIGAGDGAELSNTRALHDAGWMGICVERDPNKAAKIDRPVVICTDASMERGHRIRDLANNTPIDFLSVDIDGNDYWIVQQYLMRYSPVAVCVEYNPDYSEPVTIRYDPQHIWDGSMYYGASGALWDMMMAQHGYRCIACTGINLIYHRGAEWITHKPKVRSTGFPPPSDHQQSKLIWY